jgi:hypothetical protein
MNEPLTLEELIILLKHLAGKHGGHVRTNIVTVDRPKQEEATTAPVVELWSF